MEIWHLSVKNQTDAMKGKNFLQSLNINSSVEKIGGKGGCTYAIKIKGSPDIHSRASRLLSTVGVEVIRAVKGRR